MSTGSAVSPSPVRSSPDGVTPPSDPRLLREEYAIARRYMGRVPWEMVAWGIGNTAVWLSLFPLVLSGRLSLWIACPIATLCCTLAYLPSHEAQHSIIGAEETRWRWLNELVGHVSLLPLVFPYRIAWITHKQHHAHANDPERDPDHSMQARNLGHAILASLRVRQLGRNVRYQRCLSESDDPNLARAVAEGAWLNLGFYAVLTGMAWSGHAIEAALLWWLPRHIGYTYLQVCLSWAPHHPMVETGRYRDTRAWRSPVGTLLTLWMEYHVIHHLFPKIPLLDTPRAWWEMRDLLEERGIRNEGL